MPVTMEYLILTNFKSFKGITTFGPINSMSVIVGENGSGKSNIIDAIAFVLGGRAKHMRLKRLTDLIHGANIGEAENTRAEVSASFALDNGNRILTRTVSKNSCDYKINGKVVTLQGYRDQLKEFGIILDGRNCLISQGNVESIAMESPKDLCVFFEELSGSIEYKADYDRLNEEVRDLERKMHHLMEEKKSLQVSKRAVLKYKEQTETYKALYEKSIKLKSLLQLVEIYHIEREKEALVESINEEKDELEKLVEGKERILAKIKEIVKQKNALKRRLEATETNCRELEDSVKNKETIVIRIQEQIAHYEAKLKDCNKTLTEERVAQEAHDRTIKELQVELMDIERLQREFDDSVTEELSAHFSNVELSNSQVREYMRLKSVVEKEASWCINPLKELQQQLDTDQCELDNEERKKADLKDKLHYQKIAKDEAEKRTRKLEHYVKETEDKLALVIQLKTNVSEKFKLVTERRADIESRLSAIHNELKDAVQDTQMIIGLKQKAETLNLLRNLNKGVHCRVSELCKPVHSRYNVAVTKVFGKFIEAIVVDTLETATKCISQLKRQKLGVETFLPLDNLKVVPLNERLRDISGVTNVKPLYDVIQIKSGHGFDKVILFITKNILVCDSLKDACKIAYEFPVHKRQNCVTLEGSLYRKDGTFSGGLADLSKRAKVWEEKELEILIAKQKSLQDEMKTFSRTFDFESDLNNVDTEVKGYTTRLKYSSHSLDEARETLATTEEKIKALSEKLNLVCSTIVSINARMKERKQSIQDLKNTTNTVEDKVYSSFCQQVGVSNIRQYEQHDLIHHQKREERRLELEEQFNRISNMLNYEMGRDQAKSNLKKNEELAKTIAQDCEKARRKQALEKLQLEEAKRRLEAEVSVCTTRKAELAELQKTLNTYREEITLGLEAIRSSETRHITLLSNIERKKLETQCLIKNSKITGIPVPFLRGRIGEALEDTPATSSTHQETSSELTDSSQHLQVDYSELPEDLKSTDVSITKSRLNAEIAKIETELQEIHPDMKVEEKLEVITRTLNDIGQKIRDIGTTFKVVNMDFQTIKDQRLNAFNECFDYISKDLAEVYMLYKDPTATAYIMPEDAIEPYLGGLHFSCMAANKRAQPMDSLSGGEKTFASLAMIFALNKFRRTPFFVLDEVDAALDKQAVRNLIDFILKKKSELQFIIVSLGKLPYYADVLFGVTNDPDSQTVESLIFSFDLSGFPRAKERKIDATAVPENQL